MGMCYVMQEWALKAAKNDDLEMSNNLVSIKHKVGFLHRYKIQGQRIRARMNWLRDGDIGSKHFFNIIRAKHKVEKIEDIQIEGGKTNDPKVIKEAFYSFYFELLLFGIWLRST